MTRHLLTGAELTRGDLDALLARAIDLKAAPRSSRALADRIVALVFEKPSTRTRISFEVGIVELGGHPMILRGDELQLSCGESVKDTARPPAPSRCTACRRTPARPRCCTGRASGSGSRRRTAATHRRRYSNG